ncbi:hypothetical protein SUGI_0381830 [Cryptomeria japonica]|nr:hypothetical protein SUGI_0381830 [Cryptomeria japonica]
MIRRKNRWKVVGANLEISREGKEELKLSVPVINSSDYHSLTIPAGEHVSQDVEVDGYSPHKIGGHETTYADFLNCK